MPLASNQRRYLRELAHPLKPVVTIGAKGVTEAVIKELQQSLEHHELLKVRLSGDREQRAAALAKLLSACDAQDIQTVGHVASLYRANPDQPRLALPPANEH